MSYTLHECWMSCWGLLAIPVFFFAPGFVLGSLTGLMRFGQQGWIERILWAAALSTPMSLILAVHPFCRLPESLTTAIFLGFTAVAVLLLVREKDRPRLVWDRNATLAVSGACFIALYCLLSAVPLEFFGRLYENAFWQDWNVRIQLVNAAIRDAAVPRNPMFAPGGDAAPLRYYYFWYVLCARMHDVVPVSTRAIFTISCVGAGWSLLAFLLLSLKYLGASRRHLRAQGVALMLSACILGYDLIVFAVAAADHHFFPNLQFWLEDRTPRLLQVILWSPHHAAGLVCGGLGTILIVHSLQVSAKQRLIHGALAGLCFAAAAGTSTFIAVLFSSVLLFLCVDSLFRREFPVIVTVAVAALFAVLLDAPFLYRMASTVGLAKPTLIASGVQHGVRPSAEPLPMDAYEREGIATAKPEDSVPTAAQPLMSPLPRYMNQSLKVVWSGLDLFGRDLLHRRIYQKTRNPTRDQRILLTILHRPIILGFFFLDLGFFAYVLFRQARIDLILHRPMPRQARVLWLIFFGIAIPGTRFTSAPLQANNDFARHAGLGMLYVLLLWSAPVVAEFLERRKHAIASGSRLLLTWPQKFAVAAALIGLAGQAVQIALDRVRVPLTDAGLLPHIVIAEYVPRLGFRFREIQQAMAAATALTGPKEIVQPDPHSILAPVFLLYAGRQMAASDDGCNTPFGGDPSRCLPLTRDLIGLFGGTGHHFFADLSVLGRPIAFDPSLVTVSNLAHVCTLNHMDIIAADYTDPVWSDRHSWVWTLPTLYANSTMRLYRCPGSAGAPTS